jgi:formate transporter
MSIEQNAALCVQTNPGLQKLVMGAVGLPFGLIMVMICGAELFTGNTMIMGCAFYEGRITLPQLLRSWVVSFGSEPPQSSRGCFWR